MRRRSATLTTLTMALGAVFLFGCQDQGPTQATLDDIPPDFTPGFAKGGKGGGPGGGGAVPVSVWSPTFGGIVATEGAGDTVPDWEIPMNRQDNDSHNKLRIAAGGYDEDSLDPVAIDFDFTALAAEQMLAQCEMNGSYPGITKEIMVGVLRGDPPPGGFREGDQRRIVIVVKKDRLGLEHREHRVTAGKQDSNGLWWWEATIGANRRALVYDEDVTPPDDSRTWTKYTWAADHPTAYVSLGIRFGPEVELLRCPYEAGDEVSITVIEG